MKHDVGNGLRAEVVALKGKGGYVAAIYQGSRHLATVADPEDSTRDGALMQARIWGIEFKGVLHHAE